MSESSKSITPFSYIEGIEEARQSDPSMANRLRVPVVCWLNGKSRCHGIAT